MSNITDYVRWYKDTGFDAKPFTKVDNIVLCQLSYIDFKPVLGEDYVSSSDAITLSECIAKFGEMDIPIRKQAPDDSERFTALVRACAESVRFGKLKISRFKDVYSDDSSIQFCTVTFSPAEDGNDKASYVAFRGTDSTIAGWKEDFMFSFTLTGAQKMAAEHLSSEIDRVGKVLTGGHSKGGHLAMYAASCLDGDRFSKIVRVYTNDGPGFCEDVFPEETIAKIDPVTTRIIPVFSIVGCQFEPHITDCYIVKSDKLMLDQHELCSWQIDHGELSDAGEKDPISVMLNEGINRWLNSIDLKDRKKFVDALFDSMSEGGTKTLQEFSDLGLIGWERVFNSVIKDDATVRKIVASLPDQVLFKGDAGKVKKKITRWTIYRQYMSSELAKGLMTILIGLTMTLISEGFIFALVGTVLIIVTTFFVSATIRRLIKDKWNLNKNFVYAILSILLIAVTLITFIKEGALFVMGSALFGTAQLAEAYNCVNRTKKETWKFRRVFLIIMSVIWASSGTFILFAPEKTLLFYMVIVGTVATIDGCIRSVLSFHKKNGGASKVK